MNTRQGFSQHVQRWLATGLLAAVMVLPLSSSTHFLVPSTAHAISVADLQAQKKAAEAKAAQAAADAAKQKQLAALAASKVQEVTGEIQTIQSGLQQTQQNLTSTQQQISDKDQETANLQSTESSLETQLDALVREMYITWLSTPDTLAFASTSISQRQEKQAQFMALKKSVTVVYNQTQAAKMAVAQQRADLAKKNDQLTQLQNQQNSQKSALAVARFNQQDLQQNALSAAQRLQQESDQAKAQAAQIDAKIKILTATTNWGSGISSGPAQSWSMYQTGNYRTLGYSPYTINDYGCLITSDAMVSEYYHPGNGVTPTYIAQNGGFDRNGYLLWLPGNLGFSRQSPQAINWSVANSEVAAGRPVIIGIYLASVGPINAFGVSHFVVYYGPGLIQDPLGQGRSYPLSAVKDMILTSPQ